MKAKFHFFLLFAALILASCDRWKPAAPAPAPEPKPSSSVALAPSGKLYVIKRFSVTTEDGLHGFSPGKEVALVRVEQDAYVVTDGIVEGKAPKDSFSVNPDIAKAVGDKHQQLQQSAQQRLNEQSQAAKLQQAAGVQQAQKDAEDKKIAQRKQQISDIQIQLDDLSQRISKARAERSSKGFPQDGGPRRSGGYYYNGSYYRGYGHGSTVSLSTDATQIETLLSAKAALESQLRNLNRN
ncbi:MAG: hypothetical protein NTV93_04155 [Verrucomicrobia bacterium]|nr:hypothetical protein [Verrucomicrobiota bacterium]